MVTRETKVTFAAVTRESGVSTALIHSYYPSIAEAIREAQGRFNRALRDMKHQDLIAERKKSADYRQELEELRMKIAHLAPVNEVILDENRTLKAKLSDRKVVDMTSRNSHL